MREMFLNMNQKVMLEIKESFTGGKGKSKVDLADFILLRRVADFILSSKTITVIKDNEVYHWVNYGTIQESLPVVFPSKVSLKKRIEKLKNLGLIVNKKHNVKVSDTSKEGFKSAGTYSIIQLSHDVKRLFDEPIKDSITSEGVKGKHSEGVKGYPSEGVNKEPQEKNSKKETPSLENGDSVSLSEDEKQLLKNTFMNAMKLVTVSSATNKKYGTSKIFISTELEPLAKRNGTGKIINAIKSITMEAKNLPIDDIKGLIISRI